VGTDPPSIWQRVVERRRAVTLSRHFREVEELSLAQIAERLGRSPATVKSYFCDRRGEGAGRSKPVIRASVAVAVRTRQPRHGNGDAYALRRGRLRHAITPSLSFP